MNYMVSHPDYFSPRDMRKFCCEKIREFGINFVNSFSYGRNQHCICCEELHAGL